MPRPAATVILLRDGLAGVEVWLMERSRAVGFMGAAWVFPGGRVDPTDADLPGEPGIADGIPRAFRAAAARELEEEAGVRLGDADGYALDSLRVWAHWITPEIDTRRYDTWFFVARAPADAVPRIDGREAVAGGWFRPVDALRRTDEGTLPLSPPTVRTLMELLPFSDVATTLAAQRRTPPICPRFTPAEGDDVWVLLPGDPEFPSEDPVEPPFRFPFAVGRWRAR